MSDARGQDVAATTPPAAPETIAEMVAMLFWALMASGQIAMRRVDGWQTLDQAPVERPLDLAA